MESIKELRLVCQAGRRAQDTWHGKYIARPVSIYITALFLKIGLSANVATLIFLLSGIAGSILLTFADKMLFFTGMLLIELWYILDHVDGEVARYRKQTSVTGFYFDSMSHYISHPMIFLCVGLGLYNAYGDIGLFVTSAIAGYSIIMVTAVEDVFDSVLYKTVSKYTLSNIANADLVHKGRNKKGIMGNFFSFVHKLCTFPVVMNILFFASVVNIFSTYNIIGAVVTFYAIFATVVWLARLFVFIKERRPDTAAGTKVN